MRRIIARTESAITLMALVVTIIVLLVLAGATLTLLIGENGIITRAEKAKAEAIIETEREELQLAATASADENLQISTAQRLKDNLHSGWSVSGEDGGPYMATSPNENIFTVDKNGTVVYIGDKETHEHNWGEWIVEQEATCEAKGLRIRYCIYCDAKEEGVLQALGHNWGEWIIEKEAICEEGGIKSRICSRCNTKETRTIAALGHNFGEWTTEKAATCEAEGIEAKTCSRCNAKETRTITALGHNYTKTEVNPSYSGRGYYKYTCSRCQNTYTENTNKDLVIIDGLNWTSSNWTSRFNNSNSSGFYSSGFGGVVSPNKISLVASYIGNYGSAWTGPINLTDAKSVQFTYTQYDNLYYYNAGGIFGIGKKEQRGINTTTVGIADSGDLVKEQNFVSGKYQTTTYTRTSSSNNVAQHTVTIDVSNLTGNYYIKGYISHTSSGDSVQTAYTAYTGMDNIKIIYK